MKLPPTSREERRAKAEEMLGFKMSKAAVARELKIARTTLDRLMKHKGGLKGRVGRPFRLTGETKKKVVFLLREGPAKCGCQGRLWVVSEAVEKCKPLGFEGSAATMWRILHRLGLTPKAAHAKALEERRARYEAKKHPWRVVAATTATKK